MDQERVVVIYDSKDNDKVAGYTIICPACRDHHEQNMGRHFLDDRWTFNKNLTLPSFSSSLLVHEIEEMKDIFPKCHSYINDGKIWYLDDCTHAMAGQTVELPICQD